MWHAKNDKATLSMSYAIYDELSNVEVTAENMFSRFSMCFHINIISITFRNSSNDWKFTLQTLNCTSLFDFGTGKNSNNFRGRESLSWNVAQVYQLVVFHLLSQASRTLNGGIMGLTSLETENENSLEIINFDKT
jgi:hypothetical protein